ncbi:MAG: hypothetical protein Ct9H300mP8_05390 [Gammaproteobacteria bacterium]|nr:MAG: hypothetical protein Ct9H300mP8_05390 [Gammaproteobacteria bacterium]
MTHHPEAVIETDLSRVLERDDVQILVVCTPHDLHPANTIAAAQAGKHILIEKPAALDTSSLRCMHEEVAKAGVKSVVSFVLRWNPLFDVIKAQQANGALGRVYMTEVDYVHGVGPWYGQYEWCRTLAQGRSSFLNAGCHAIDALRYFTESDVTEVSAYTVAGSDRFEYPGTAVMICKFEKGLLVRLFRISMIELHINSGFPCTAILAPCSTTVSTAKPCQGKRITPRFLPSFLTAVTCHIILFVARPFPSFGLHRDG